MIDNTVRVYATIHHGNISAETWLDYSVNYRLIDMTLDDLNSIHKDLLDRFKEAHSDFNESSVIHIVNMIEVKNKKTEKI